MFIVDRDEFQALIEKYPNGGIVFAEYTPDVITSELMVTDGDFGATCVLPYRAEVYDFDWSIKEYEPDAAFMIYENNDVLQMIKTLTSGLNIKLEFNRYES